MVDGYKIAMPVSIHAPREGCDVKGIGAISGTALFQFTHPGRGATRIVYFKGNTRYVSIHAPREGCDFNEFGPKTSQSVSIHAPREGCDWQYFHGASPASSFNSRTPGGVRRQVYGTLDESLKFQFTHPGRGATPIPLRRSPTPMRFNSRTPGGVRLPSPFVS